MDVSEEQFEKEELAFFSLKQIISEELDIRGTDDDIEESLKRLLAMESEIFNNSMNDLVLKKYYENFLDKIDPQIISLTEKNNDSCDLQMLLFFDKIRINQDNSSELKKAVDAYCYQVNDEFLVNELNSHEVLLSEDFKRLWAFKDKDLFQVPNQLDEMICSKHLEIKYNYDPAFWKDYSNKIKKDLILVNKRIIDKIPDFQETLKLYEQHIKLYKIYIRKYRYISAYNDLKEGRIQCQK